MGRPTPRVKTSIWLVPGILTAIYAGAGIALFHLVPTVLLGWLALTVIGTFYPHISWFSALMTGMVSGTFWLVAITRIPVLRRVLMYFYHLPGSVGGLMGLAVQVWVSVDAAHPESQGDVRIKHLLVTRTEYPDGSAEFGLARVRTSQLEVSGGQGTETLTVIVADK